jgi:Zn-dependent peptidase ImmA (M78 family)
MTIKKTANQLKMDSEANQFAMELLMPEYKFVEICNIFNGNLLYIADFFGVSIDTAHIRCVGLGLASPS